MCVHVCVCVCVCVCLMAVLSGFLRPTESYILIVLIKAGAFSGAGAELSLSIPPRIVPPYLHDSVRIYYRFFTS